MTIPVRKYLHQLLRHWLARMLSRKDIEAWLRLRRTQDSNDPMKDIFDGMVLQSFTAPGENHVFLQAPDVWQGVTTAKGY